MLHFILRHHSWIEVALLYDLFQWTGPKLIYQGETVNEHWRNQGRNGFLFNVFPRQSTMNQSYLNKWTELKRSLNFFKYLRNSSIKEYCRLWESVTFPFLRELSNCNGKKLYSDDSRSSKNIMQASIGIGGAKKWFDNSRNGKKISY